MDFREILCSFIKIGWENTSLVKMGQKYQALYMITQVRLF
jgi:hypothetical protein